MTCPTCTALAEQIENWIVNEYDDVLRGRMKEALTKIHSTERSGLLLKTDEKGFVKVETFGPQTSTDLQRARESK